MSSSLHGESLVLFWLLVGLVVLVVGQVTVRLLWSVPSSPSRVDRWLPDAPVFAAPGFALAGMLGSVLLLVPWGVLNTFVFHVSKGPLPDAFWLPWSATWSLVPCVLLGYRSGRWWSFLGAAPMLVLWPLGVAITDGADWFLTLPITAAIAVALSFGSALRSARRRERLARHHRPLPT